MITLEAVLDEQLAHELRFIDANLINKATLRAQRAIARPVLQDAMDEAPEDTSNLRVSQSITSFFNRHRGVSVTYVGLSKKHHPEWLTTRALAMEYGNDRVRAQPYLAVAAEQNRERVLKQFSAFLEKHLDKLMAGA